MLGLRDYSIGDLVIFLQSLEWEKVNPIEGEIGIVIQIFETQDEENFFDLNIQLSDGGMIPVWLGEVEKLENV